MEMVIAVTERPSNPLVRILQLHCQSATYASYSPSAKRTADVIATCQLLQSVCEEKNRQLAIAGQLVSLPTAAASVSISANLLS